MDDGKRQNFSKRGRDASPEETSREKRAADTAHTVHYTPIKDITPETKRDWAVQVRVLEKSSPRTPANSSKKYQRLILIDKQGTKVQATIFGADIDLFANSLKVLHIYQISNATVTPINTVHQIVPHDYQWTINKRTPITELVDAENEITVPLSLVRFLDLHKYMNVQAQVDIMAVVIDSLPEKCLTINNANCAVQEFAVVNEELRPTLLTTWDQFIPNEAAHILDLLNEWPIILATHLKVGSYNGLSLSTKSSTMFLINLNLPEAAKLRSWAIKNEQTIKRIVDEKQYSIAASTSICQAPSKISMIKDIPAIPCEGETFKIQAHASVANMKQKFLYMCCNKCQKPTDAQYQSSSSCIHCNKLVMATLRCCIKIQLKDSSAMLTATVFGEKAEKLFSVTATQLHENTKEDGTVDIQHFNAASDDKQHLFILKASRRTYRNHEIIKFVVISILDATNT